MWFMVHYRSAGQKRWRVQTYSTEAGMLAAAELFERCGYEVFVTRPALAMV